MWNEIRLRPLRREDETAALEAHTTMASEAFPFLLDHVAGEPWEAYLRRLQDQSRGLNLPPDRVPCTFLVATAGNVIAGRVSIRHELNEYLACYGGHVGYGVLSEHRRRGYAVEMLRQGLVVARSHGVDEVLVTCDDDNVGSIRVIEANGGVLDSLIEEPGSKVLVRRYWIR